MKGSLRMEEPVHTSWSRFCIVNHRASASNYQLSNLKVPGLRFEPATSAVEGVQIKQRVSQNTVAQFVILSSSNWKYIAPVKQ